MTHNAERVWVVSTNDAKCEHSAWAIDSIHASFESANSRLNRLAVEFPEWGLQSRAWQLHNDGNECAD